MKLKRVVLITVLILFYSCKTESEVSNGLSMNPSIIEGSIDNGIKYYIKENVKPENRVELRLVVNAGSILESDEERGLAHFVEHMAFNGTKNFEKDNLIKYLESLGMGFGPEINAYTSFDETVYQLSIPSDDEEAINKGFQILEDWARYITLSDEDIEAERGVIVEEWRLGRGAQSRYWDKVYPTILEDSLYADRLPIGDVEVIKNCDPQLLRDFYKRWYRPDLMSVVVVGDIDPILAEEKILKHFSYQGGKDKKERKVFDIPFKNRLDIEIVRDREQTTSDISYFIKKPGQIIDNRESYLYYLTEILSVVMFNTRMEEIFINPDSPFLNASANYGTLVRGANINSFRAQVEDGMVVTGLEALLTEIEGVRLNGFSEDELTRAKSLVAMIMENYYNERDNKTSLEYVSEIIDLITEGHIPMEISYDMEIVNSMLPEVTLDLINNQVKKSFTGEDRIFTLHIPEDKEGIPGEEEIRELFIKVANKDIEAREDETLSREIFTDTPQPGEIVDEVKDEETGIVTLTLDNGIDVILKATDFKSDEILFSAVSFGGFSHIEDHELFSGTIAADLVNLSGLNGLNTTELNRLLTGKSAIVSPWISNYDEGLNGKSSKKDLELLFQLINLNFTKPEFSTDSYDLIVKNVSSYLKDKENSPEAYFNDRVVELAGDGHFRAKPLDMDSIRDSDFEESKRIYLERFKDPSDFTFIFTGSFDEREIRELIKSYLGSLKTYSSDESAIDLGVYPPKGIVKEDIYRGIEEKSTVEILFNGEFDGSYEDEFLITTMVQYLQERLRIKIREELGGTYGVSVFSNIRYYPFKKYFIGIYFGCEPGREDELINALFNEIETLQSGSYEADILQGVVQNQIRTMELNIKENSFWLGSITDSILLDRDFNKIPELNSEVITGENLVKTAIKYINRERYIEAVLKPEE